MEITFFNGKFIPKEEVKISPDDRGFLFADGIYEVVRWYEGFFFDMESHLLRLKRSLRELRINWDESDLFPSIALDLIKQNKLEKNPALLYIQVTRGAARRTHSFPSPGVPPTVYANVWSFIPDTGVLTTGIKVMLKEDIRWSRCDIKSVSLLANTISFQEAYENGFKESVFIRNGLITEGSHSNIFFVIDTTLYTHPESNYILTGITRNNILRIAKQSGLNIKEEAISKERLRFVQEAFITNTSAEVTPVIEIGRTTIGDGIPGPVTRLICEKFNAEISALKA
jgi:D-alanine transaminase